MKKVFLFLAIILTSVTVSGQFQGLGTEASPYYGTLSGNSTIGPGAIWMGYPGSGDLSTGGYRLTIAAGTTLYIYENININIPAGGRLNALGTSSSPITFTSSTPSTSWGRLVFTNSRIEQMVYCIFEKGSAPENGSGGAIYAEGVQQYYGTINHCEFRYNVAPRRGGAIYCWNSNLTIINSSFHNNEAMWGGALAFNGASGNPLVDRCRIYSNTATNNEPEGAGIYLPVGAQNVTIRNTLIYNNTCINSTTGGGGIYCGGIVEYICQFIDNCVISNNSPMDVKISAPSQVTFQNTIIWGTENSVFYDFGTPLPDNLLSCSVQRVYRPAGEIDISTFPTSFKLNSSNTAVDGPNFTDPAINDYSITINSPCRDAGVATGALSTPPLTDFLQHDRIGAYDIGAYEFQYSRWVGTTSNVWDNITNWQGGLPSITSDVIIPAGLPNYPTSSSTQDFILGAGKQMIIEPAASATFGTLTNNGILKLKSSSSGIASLMLNTYARGTGGTEEIQLYLTGGEAGSGNYRWHFISSPVTPSIPASIFENQTPDLAAFVEELYTGESGTGWIGSDGYIYSSEQPGDDLFDDLWLGKGYNFYDNPLSGSETFTFGGILNTSPFSNLLDCLIEDSETSGFNLLGNPFSCGINWDVISNSANYPLNTSKAVFFTKDNVTYTYSNEVGVPIDATANIPPMQGFFVKTYSSGNTLTIPLSAREHNLTQRYKGTNSGIPLIRLSIKENNKTDETVVRFDDLAKPGVDFDFDATKMNGVSQVPSISSLSDNTDMTINGLPFPDQKTEIPLSITVGKTSNGNHTIKATQLQGLDNYLVVLTDKRDNVSINLKTNPNFTFAAPEGTITNRFVLKVGIISTGIEDLVGKNNQFNIYSSFGYINIQTLSDDWEGLNGFVKISDLTGKAISFNSNQEFRKGSIIQVSEPDKQGIFIIEIRSGMKRFTGKVMIK